MTCGRLRRGCLTQNLPSRLPLVTLAVSVRNSIVLGLSAHLEAPNHQRQDFEKFQELVLEDRVLHDQLRATANEPAFIELAVHLARERGCNIAPEFFREVIMEKRRAWLERWL